MNMPGTFSHVDGCLPLQRGVWIGNPTLAPKGTTSPFRVKHAPVSRTPACTKPVSLCLRLSLRLSLSPSLCLSVSLSPSLSLSVSQQNETLTKITLPQLLNVPPAPINSVHCIHSFVLSGLIAPVGGGGGGPRNV